MSDDIALLECFSSGKNLLALLSKLEKATRDQIVKGTVKLLKEVSPKIGKDAPTIKTEIDTSTATAAIPDLRFISPQGKFTLFFMTDSIILKNDKSSTAVPLSVINHVAILDRIPKEAQKKPNEVIIFISLQKGASVMNGNKILQSIVIQTSEDAVLMLPGEDGQPEQQQVPVSLCLLLGKAGLTAPFLSPEESVYKSRSDAPAIVAVHGNGTGWLYPMQDAFYVEKPIACLRHEDVAAYEVTSGMSRSELVLHMNEGPIKSFGFDKAELPRLQTYLEKSIIKVYDAIAVKGKGKKAFGADANTSGRASADGKPIKRIKRDPGDASTSKDPEVEEEEAADEEELEEVMLDDDDDEDEDFCAEEDDSDQDDGDGDDDSEEDDDEDSDDSDDGSAELIDEEGISAADVVSKKSRSKNFEKGAVAKSPSTKPGSLSNKSLKGRKSNASMQRTGK
ncbi:hypothetical protein CEUSTIGMA_g282.t1 [Chlamydomonas eustigma]|uniref:FACT complex subunit SSRP1 n=1 Tax=Chlamydomonas eustigma TaxID=1157962 RepID=A0A250WPQ4_9CHLO|nr:hypothetical protein CEUSTIGMA_g282.t1 [Chlamydomonas eustigma]|eukprot:GAX72827.1 hypothetical protein CEUSTIGMA_g282.t1 [Chlamydomonas eustigma]